VRPGHAPQPPPAPSRALPAGQSKAEDSRRRAHRGDDSERNRIVGTADAHKGCGQAGCQGITNWDLAANINVAILRTHTGRNPFDKGLTDLVGELSVRSEEFRTRWAAHNVRRHYTGTKVFRHPVVGELELAYEAMELAEDPGFTLTVFPAVPGSASDERLRLLASWAATERIQELAGAAQPQDVQRP